MRHLGSTAVAIIILASCGVVPQPLPPLPRDSFAFGVFGDGPYTGAERGRYRQVLQEVSAAHLAWLVHVGDLFWYPCSDEAYLERLHDMQAVDAAVVYTPGDNEWTDCHRTRQGRFAPLERLATLRRTFFPVADSSLGRRRMAVATQSADSAFGEFVENARWERAGMVFATIHVVGSDNAGESFGGRSTGDDAAAARRTAAALAWLDAAFARARERAAPLLVLALHANVGLEQPDGGQGYAAFVTALRRHTSAFRGEVLLIHGDSHTLRVDRPLADSTGRPLPNFTRLETYGSPDIGWVRVTVDTVAGRVVRIDPRPMRGRS